MARTIAFAGGGTMGPVAPLLAVYKILAKKHPDFKFVWVGTAEGPERQPVEQLGIEFVSIPTVKFPRYPSLRWLTLLWDFFKAKKAAKEVIKKYQPNLIVGAGGFTQVPLMCAGKKSGVLCLAHQLDFQPTLSNISVAKFCQMITTTFVYHYHKFNKCHEEKRIATPNRFTSQAVPEKASACSVFGLDSSRPVLLVVGGGTGSKVLNDLIEQNIDPWLKLANVIHLTGKNRSSGLPEKDGYVRREFLNEKEMFNALAAADLVISRAGMGAITDFAALSKAVVLIPIANSHQEKNSRHLPNAVIEVKEGPELFERAYKSAKRLLEHKDLREKLGYQIHKDIKTDDGSELASIIEKLIPE